MKDSCIYKLLHVKKMLIFFLTVFIYQYVDRNIPYRMILEILTYGHKLTMAFAIENYENDRTGLLQC